ncbi:uncharacterized protein LOC126577730 [Anopheles aquasalis]|uniref:uncharacterized protein LOC126577730 n=1 Tax=Anopheles aquasalis TaxID=42839 RepID=UPI00215AA22E|nr:uncharacterized protein LOC126577730 [Anopheles aquasalis]
MASLTGRRSPAFWLLLAILCPFTPVTTGEQEQLEPLTFEPLHCERIDGEALRRWIASEPGARRLCSGTPSCDRVLMCDCQKSAPPQWAADQQVAFTLPPFETTTVATNILIRNCGQLQVPTGTFRALRSGFLPRTVRFLNIEQLTLESFAFEIASQSRAPNPDPRDRHPVLGPIELHFERCHIEELPANVFHGAGLRSIQFSASSSIGVIQPLAIGIRLRQLTIRDSAIGRFARHAFKRAQMEELLLQNVTMYSAWTSQGWQGVVVTETIQITDSTFLQPIHPAAITESSTNELLLQNNVFNASMADEAFQLAITSRVSLIGNVFGQLSPNLFRGLVISNETAWNAQPALVLERNQIDELVVPGPANAPVESSFFHIPRNFTVNLQSLRISELATCDSTNLAGASQWHQEIFFLRPFAVSGHNDPESYISIEEFREQEGCDATQDLVLIIVLSTLLGVTLIGGLIGGLLFYRHQKKRQRMLLLEQGLVHPAPRTYRETQIMLKLETVGTLKTDF